MGRLAWIMQVYPKYKKEATSRGGGRIFEDGRRGCIGGRQRVGDKGMQVASRSCQRQGNTP